MTIAGIPLETMILLGAEIGLILYSSFEFCKLCKGERPSGLQRKLRRSKIAAYTLIMLCTVMQIFSQLNGLINFMPESQLLQRIIPIVCEIIPTLLMFSLTLDLADFWLQLYCCFESDSYSMMKTIAKVEKTFIIINVAVYFIAGILTTAFLYYNSSGVLLVLLITLLASFVFGVIMFVRQGLKICNKLVGRLLESAYSNASGFAPLFLLAIVCLYTKALYEGIIIYKSYQGGTGLDVSFLYAEKDQFEYWLYTTLYIVGQFGSLLSLIFLLKMHATQNNKTATVSTFIGDMEDDILDQEEVTTPRGDISVSLLIK
jgi:hypothetical protein